MKIKVEAVIEIDPSDVERFFVELSEERVTEILNDKENTEVCIISTELALVMGDGRDFTWTIVEG